MREAARLSDTIGSALGVGVRAGRKRLKLTQSELADRVGVHQTWISRIELGQGQAVPLHLWIRIGLVLGQPLAVTFSRMLGETRLPADAGHLLIQESLLRLARATGRAATFELPTRPTDPARSVDVCVRDARHRVLIVEEAWNTFGDIGAAVRSTKRKSAEAVDLAETIDDGPAYRVATVWVVRDSAGNREVITRFPEILASTFTGSSRDWTRALTTEVAPPANPGLVWYDASTDRIREWRRPRVGPIARTAVRPGIRGRLNSEPSRVTTPHASMDPGVFE
jgi:transcriptional regulator with XRE-family HTH domain